MSHATVKIEKSQTLSLWFRGQPTRLIISLGEATRTCLSQSDSWSRPCRIGHARSFLRLLVCLSVRATNLNTKRHTKTTIRMNISQGGRSNRQFLAKNLKVVDIAKIMVAQRSGLYRRTVACYVGTGSTSLLVLLGYGFRWHNILWPTRWACRLIAVAVVRKRRRLLLHRMSFGWHRRSQRERRQSGERCVRLRPNSVSVFVNSRLVHGQEWINRTWPSLPR